MPFQAQAFAAKLSLTGAFADMPFARPRQAPNAPRRGADHARPGIFFAPAPEQTARSHAPVNRELNTEWAIRRQHGSLPAMRAAIRFRAKQDCELSFYAADAEPQVGQCVVLGMRA